MPGEYLSAEAQSAAAAYEGNQSRIGALLRNCFSGRELIDKGFEQDVRDCAQIDAYDVVPILNDGAYRADVIDDLRPPR
jgi:2-phosphosulfolactate phosphatase